MLVLRCFYQVLFMGKQVKYTRIRVLASSQYRWTFYPCQISRLKFFPCQISCRTFRQVAYTRCLFFFNPNITRRKKQGRLSPYPHISFCAVQSPRISSNFYFTSRRKCFLVPELSYFYFLFTSTSAAALCFIPRMAILFLVPHSVKIQFLFTSPLPKIVFVYLTPLFLL